MDPTPFIVEKGGVLVKSENGGIIIIRCDKGHIFKYHKANLVQGHWCPECKKYETAKTMSHKYIGNNLVVCKNGHRYAISDAQFRNRAINCKVCPGMIGRYRPEKYRPGK
jgi:hypothetical protein